jgi:DNA-directed RNA polymerase I, II, and III subunit RPABC2
MATNSIIIVEKNKLTKYEIARIIGTRAIQISKGAPIKIPLKDGEFQPLKIAEKEFDAGKIPYIIRRHLPSGEHVDVKFE